MPTHKASDAFILPTVGFANTDTAAQVPIGTIRKGVDALLGEAEFIYLQGLAATAVGELVTYDHNAGTTTRAILASRGPCAIAMSANVAGQFGWYQLTGIATCKCNAVLANTKVYATATPGLMDDAVAAGSGVDGATFKTVDGAVPPAAGFAYAQLDRPAMNGNG